MECLENIIGITNSDCPCVIDGLTPEEVAKLRESASGLYLDELEGGVNIRSLEMLDACQNMAEMALGARDTATKKLKDDVIVALQSKYKSGKKSYVGSIGRPTYTGNMNVSAPHQFMRLRARNMSDAIMKISGIRLIVDRAAMVVVEIIRAVKGGNQGEVIFSEAVTTSANAYTTIPLAEPLELPLSGGGESYDYYVVWSRLGTEANPKDIKISCNCSGGTGYEQYLDVVGGELNDTNNLSAVKTDKYSHGLSLDVDIRCKPGDLICREYDRENAIAVTMAWATMYKAGELLIEAVMNSGEVNRYTMMNREYLWGKRNHFRKEYDARIMYLASNMDVTSSDCFICRDTHFFKAGILS